MMHRFIKNFKPLFKQCDINYDDTATIKLFDKDEKQFIFQTNIINIALKEDNVVAFHGKGLWTQIEFDDRTPHRMVLSTSGQLRELYLTQLPHVEYIAPSDDIIKYSNYLHHLYDGLWNNMEMNDKVSNFDNLMSRRFDTAIYFILKF